MKKGFRIFLSLVLATSVLIASTGVVIASHVCLTKNKSNISLFESKSCCSKHTNSCSPVPVIKKKCCQLSISYHKLQVNTVVKSASTLDEVSVPVVLAIHEAPGYSFFQYNFSFADSPPDIQRLLPGSKNFLHSIHLLLI